MRNNIVLCGFMGCGKSTVGRILADRLGFALKDSDASIEEHENMTVSEIFAARGEEYFRRLETEIIKELSLEKSLVIATGGGAVLNPDNAEALRNGGTVFFLDVTPETVLERLKNDTSRPLLQREDKEMAVRELLNTRRPKYKAAAHFTIDANLSAEAVAEICEKIIKSLDNKVYSQ